MNPRAEALLKRIRAYDVKMIEYYTNQLDGFVPETDNQLDMHRIMTAALERHTKDLAYIDEHANFSLF